MPLSAAAPFSPFSLRIRGRIVEYTRPAVMGIINVTPDSFYSGSRACGDVAERALRMVRDGADIIDIGACSTRPGADYVSPDEEIRRLAPAVAAIRREVPQAVISIDTFHPEVARAAILDMGADIVNDIYGGTYSPEMIPTVAQLGVPYILMHMRGTPATMASMTGYPDGVAAGVLRELMPQLDLCRQAGIADVIIDPGLGFAKTLEQNYTLLDHLPELIRATGCPALIGISRKSMLTRLLEITADEALCPTVALNALALDRGAAILRVHDVLPAVQAVRIHQALTSSL